MTPTLPNRTAVDPPYPPTMCTLDHVYSRLQPERWKRSGSLRKVAACIECNARRGQTTEKICNKRAKMERRAQNRV